MGVAGTQGFSSMLLQLTALWMEIGDGLEGLRLRLAAADALLCRIKGRLRFERLLWEDADRVLSWLRLGVSSSCESLSAVDLSLVRLRLLGLMVAVAELRALRMEL